MRAADNEGSWLLIVADNSKVKAASKYILQLTNSIYSASKSQISLDAWLPDYTVPEIEGKAQTIVLVTQTIRGQQASAWGPVFANNETNKGGSRLRKLPSRKPRQVRKITEVSFDPESTEDFPHLQTTKPPKAYNSVTSKEKPISSSHSSVSGGV